MTLPGGSNGSLMRKNGIEAMKPIFCEDEITDHFDNWLDSENNPTEDMDATMMIKLGDRSQEQSVQRPKRVKRYSKAQTSAEREEPLQTQANQICRQRTTKPNALLQVDDRNWLEHEQFLDRSLGQSSSSAQQVQRNPKLATQQISSNPWISLNMFKVCRSMYIKNSSVVVASSSDMMKHSERKFSTTNSEVKSQNKDADAESDFNTSINH